MALVHAAEEIAVNFLDGLVDLNGPIGLAGIGEVMAEVALQFEDGGNAKAADGEDKQAKDAEAEQNSGTDG